jgi:ABC-type antimicrobial peptide transport system permease subunit
VLGIWLGSLMRNTIYDVPVIDPDSLIRAIIVLVSVTFCACLGPALRASRADPAEVMRST